MPLNLPDGASCFLDANILYYHFVDTPPFSDSCSDLLDRIAAGVITGFTSTSMIAEAVHKIMLAEAAARFGLSRMGLVNWLQKHRDRIRELSHFRDACAELGSMGLQLLSTDTALLLMAADASRRWGLLTNDATVVALILRHGLTNLATNDDDFNGVAGLTIWQPR